jgi:hypothetical protein
MATNKCLAVFGLIYLAVFITGVVLFSKSFAIVDLNTAALKQNSFSRAIEKDAIYLPGR